MANVGTIGTSAITKTFLQACIASCAFKITHVYSRTPEKAQALIDDLFIPDARADSELEAMLASTDVDIIYVASPNSLHFQHVKAALLHMAKVSLWKSQRL
jgi:predicted dehydrogenase